MGTDQKTVPKDIMQAFAVLGLAWLDRLPTVGDAIHKAVHPSLRLGEDGVWHPVDPDVAANYPDGLSLTEALGLTLVARWVERCDRGCAWSPVAGAVYGLWFETIGWSQTDDAEKVRVGAAWYTVRRAMRQPVPWSTRDPIAEEIQRVVRAASARLSPARVETLRPETIASDVGRDWRTGYGRSP